MEIVLPGALLCVSTVQLMALAFQNTIPWAQSAEEPTSRVRHVVLLEMESFQFTFRVRKEELFYGESLMELYLMLYFIVSGFTSMPHILDFICRWLQDQAYYKEERSKYSPVHLLL